MEQENYNCVWWNSFICTTCTDPSNPCKHFLDELSEEGKQKRYELEEQFNDACELVRAKCRHFDLHDEVK